jgi:wyosine [tRNA(Phe)-imidazoG37] synthetase (radical SAM superfamily)
MTYGPVRSRRLGLSLGVNLSPCAYKLCSFDCIYCQYGFTDVKTLVPAERHFPGAQEVVSAVRKALVHQTWAGQEVDCITFAGNGEPTLHPYFPRIAFDVRRLRDRFQPDAQLVILSNSSTVHLPHVREALARFDRPVMKLDAGDPETWTCINRPAPSVSLDDVIAGLKGMPGLTVQSMLLDGPVSNVEAHAFEAWLAALTEVGAQQVQIYSAERPTPDGQVQQVWPYQLARIAEEITTRTGILVDDYSYALYTSHNESSPGRRA